MHTGPLAGIRVVEIAGIGPAPFAGMVLADFGAEVIVVERKQQNGNAGLKFDHDKQAIFNRGKRSLAVDLKSQQGIDVVLKLVASADVLIEGFRPGVMERLGLGPDICQENNPKLIYGRMTGWGQTGPLAQVAAHEPNYTALSGALWYGGRADHAPSAPLSTMGDIGGGSMTLLLGILSALIHAQKTGQGQIIDAAITDGSAYNSSLLWSLYHAKQLDDEFGQGWADGGAPWNDIYQCADGRYVSVCALEPDFYRLFLDKLDLATEPCMKEQWDKSQWPPARAKLAERFLSKTQQQWCQLLEGSDACFAPVLNFSQATGHPHNIARETFVEVDQTLQPAPAPKLSQTPGRAGRVPNKGQHNDEILRELGLSEQECVALKENSVI